MNRFGLLVVCCFRKVGCHGHLARAAAAEALARRRWHPAWLVVGLVLCAAGERASAQSVWELTPYRIRLVVALAPTAQLRPELAAGLERRLLDRVESVVGARWDLSTMKPSARVRHRMTSDLAALRFEDLPQDTVKFDKILFVAVVPAVPGYQVLARELDVRTRVFGPVVRRPVWQTAKLGDTAFQAMLEVFTPLARVVQTVKKEVTLRLRAGRLPVRDPSVRRVRPGDVFQPLVRYNDRQGNLRKVHEIPLTFLVVDQCDADAFRCTLHSAMLAPMSGRRRGRVEPLALAVRPSGSATRVVLTGRVDPKPALAGYDIYEQTVGSKKTTLLGKTDVDGGIEVGQGNYPLRLLLVKSGKALLARLPVVPGLAPEMTAEIRDDDQRLEAEGFIAAMQMNLIELITRRGILSKRVQYYVTAGKVDKAMELIDELRGLPSRSDLLRELGRQQEKIVVDDLWTKKKVDELFNDTRTLLSKHLAPEPIDALARDVADAQRKGPGAAKPSP